MAPGGRPNKSVVACPIHVSNSKTKFGWISPNGLGGDSKTDRWTVAITISPSLNFKRIMNLYLDAHCIVDKPSWNLLAGF